MGDSPSDLERWCADEENDRPHRRNSRDDKRIGCKRGNKISAESNFCDKWDEDLTLLDDVVDGPECTHNRFVREFDDNMKRMFNGTGTLKRKDGTFSSTQMVSSVTTISDDGVAVSKLRGISTNSFGRYREVSQQRIGDRSQTLIKEKKNKYDEFKE